MVQNLLSLFLVLVICSGNAISQNPFITRMYAADPSARVFDDTLYVYPSHDTDTATWFNMHDWHVYSTTNMKKWKDHGVIFSLKDTKWAKKLAWAPDCVKKNGKYYFYYPTDQKHIGVAVSDHPTGPFHDPLGHPLISIDSEGVVCDRDFIDPCVLIDDDGSVYLFVGQNTVNVIKLNEDMISYDGKVHIIEDMDNFFEAAWVHKYNGKYYLSYSGKTAHKILYAMSDNVYGPYEFRGEILAKQNSITNHHSIVEYKNKWYLFYHNSALYFNQNKNDDGSAGWDGFHPYRRSICVDRLHYNSDGTIRIVVPTKKGVKRVK